MGLYDTLIIECPACGHESEVQVKSGPCQMQVYTKDNAPLNIILDVAGRVLTCKECGADHKLTLEYRTKIVPSGDEGSRWKNPIP